MDKRIILSMGLPVRVRNAAGKVAVIELNKADFVVCRYFPDNPVYLGDAKLQGWFPVNLYTRMRYRLKKMFGSIVY